MNHGLPNNMPGSLRNRDHDHRFEPGQPDAEKCAKCGRYRGAHDDTGFRPSLKPPSVVVMNPHVRYKSPARYGGDKADAKS